MAAPGAAPPEEIARKTVTILFCDVADSTGLGERLDPESVRGVMNRWFAAMRDVLTSHGGTVEKFVGDAVMAVFGVPTLHEDDALRAARASTEMRLALAKLNEELERDVGVQLGIRIGVNTGEVVAGDPASGQTFVTGDAVNVAKRLEQAARPGEILLGAPTKRLVDNAVIVEPRGSVEAKGKAEAVEAWNLLGVIADAPAFARRLDVRIVGRDEELERLRGELARAAEQRSCRLVTVLGPAGIGKSRLAAELAARSPHAQVVTARCIPYGEGLTFWPLAQAIRTAGGLPFVEQALAGGADADLVLERVRGAIDAPAAALVEETFWGVRRLLESLARERPLVVCLEDVHWGAPTFLDLVEYVVRWSRDAPILLLCLARPELLDERPGWAGLGATIPLEPLTDECADQLLDELAAEWPLAADARSRIRDAAEGNPLFVEQLVAMLTEQDGGAEVAIPPTIQALLAARLDRLDSAERRVLEHASVLGRDFTRGGVAALAPEDERSGVGTLLLSLARKELVQPGATTIRGDDGFRFRHVLIRDAAYAGLPKERRAVLHERAAEWLEHVGGVDELIGYHLEQAYRFRKELGTRVPALAERAAALLGEAGHRAFLRNDMPAAARLLDRTAALVELEPSLEREHAAALWSTGETQRAEDVLGHALERAAAAGDAVGEWLARLELAAHRTVQDDDAKTDELEQIAADAARVFDQLDHDAGRARAWRMASSVHRLRCRFRAAEHASELALGYARRAGSEREEAWLVDELCSSLLYGPTPAVDAIARCEEILETARERSLLEANVLASLAGLHGMRADFERARALAATARTHYEELGIRFAIAGLSQVSGPVLLAAGDAHAAEKALREGYDILAGVALRGAQAAYLAHAVLAQGRLDEAAVLVAEAERVGQGFDVPTQIHRRTASALLLVARGAAAEAIAEAEAAVAIAAQTDAVAMHADAELALADALAAAGRADEALAAATRARTLYELKGHAAGCRAADRRTGAVAPAC